MVSIQVVFSKGGLEKLKRNLNRVRVVGVNTGNYFAASTANRFAEGVHRRYDRGGVPPEPSDMTIETRRFGKRAGRTAALPRSGSSQSLVHSGSRQLASAVRVRQTSRSSGSGAPASVVVDMKPGKIRGRDVRMIARSLEFGQTTVRTPTPEMLAYLHAMKPKGTVSDSDKAPGVIVTAIPPRPVWGVEIQRILKDARRLLRVVWAERFKSALERTVGKE